jgi:hypothetical protein
LTLDNLLGSLSLSITATAGSAGLRTVSTAAESVSQAVSGERRSDAAPAAAATDAHRIPTPEATAKVFAARRDFEEAKELLDRLASLVDRIAQGPAGELYRLEMLRIHDNGRKGYACVALRQCRNK